MTQKKENLMLKFRVIALRRMRRSELEGKLQEAVRRGVVPEGIEIRWMDWAKGEGGQARAGTIDGAVLSDMRKFWKALAKSDIRTERVEQ